MAKRKIVWTQAADIQMTSVLEYWVQRNKSLFYSKKLSRLVLSRTLQLIEQPDLGKKTDFPETRVISLGHYSIFYKTTQDNIIITAFWDTRQDPKKLLKLLHQKV